MDTLGEKRKRLFWIVVTKLHSKSDFARDDLLVQCRSEWHIGLTLKEINGILETRYIKALTDKSGLLVLEGTYQARTE